MDVKTRQVVVGELYRHFKGMVCKIIALAHDSENPNHILVVYEELNNNKIWVRDYDMFLSPVDKEKYPDVDQEYRFQLID